MDKKFGVFEKRSLQKINPIGDNRLSSYFAILIERYFKKLHTNKTGRKKTHGLRATPRTGKRPHKIGGEGGFFTFVTFTVRDFRGRAQAWPH